MLKSMFRYLTQQEVFESVLSAMILRASKSLTVASCLKNNPFWCNFTKLNFSVCMRALESEKEFSKLLLDVGNAKKGDIANFSRN